MKIELKNTDFKYLYEWLDKEASFHSGHGQIIRNIIVKELKPQYENAFKKYQDEKQEFFVGDNVKFKCYNRMECGKIYRVSKLANGQYRYVIKYKYNEYDEEDNISHQATGYSSPLTKKNIIRTTECKEMWKSML